MGKRYEQTLHQRRRMNGPFAHEKIFNTVNY